MSEQQKKIKEEIIKIGKILYEKNLAVAKSGNISSRLDSENILITATGTSLGYLEQEDIVEFNLKTEKNKGDKIPTSELALHSLIYNNFNAKVIVHCHAPLVNGYFAVASDLKALTFETKFYLGNIPIVKQDTPTVTKPQEVIEALKTNNIVVLKNHGVVAVGNNFFEALNLIEALEEAIKTVAVARLFKKDLLDELDIELKGVLTTENASYPMFSFSHIQTIVDLVNKDEFIAQKGKELALTLQLAIKLEDAQEAYRFTFQDGKITNLAADGNAPFIISASREVWKQVFLGKIDPFVAVTQGKMQLKGQIGQLSKWYVPFNRLFRLFKEVKFK